MISDLSPIDCSNLGGLTLIEYLPTAWVDSAAYRPMVNSHYRMSQDIPVLEDHRWLRAEVLDVRRGWTEDQSPDGQQGEVFDIRVQGVLPRHSLAIAGTLSRMRNYRYLLRITDRNGQRIVLGSLEHPFVFRSQYIGGEGVAELNHHLISWQGVQPRKAVGAFPM